MVALMIIIKGQLRIAGRKNEIVYICLHNPPFHKDFHPQPWRGVEVFEAFLVTHRKAGGKLGAIFCGHLHKMYQGGFADMPVFCLPPVGPWFVQKESGCGAHHLVVTPPAVARLRIRDDGGFNLQIGMVYEYGIKYLSFNDARGEYHRIIQNALNPQKTYAALSAQCAFSI